MKRLGLFGGLLLVVILLLGGCLPVYYAGESAQTWDRSEPVNEPVPEKVREEPAASQEQEASAEADEPAVQLYALGERGPAGGFIFYDKGSSSDGWRYLEVAPKEAEKSGIMWVPGGYYDRMEQSTDAAVGTGMENTRRIVSQIGNSSPPYAALYCDQLSFGGFDDWFLPAQETLIVLTRNLSSQGIGDFHDAWPYVNYWSSTEASHAGAWYVISPDGSTSDAAKGFLGTVRAVRRF